MPFLQGEPLILYLPNGRTVSIPSLREGLKTHIEGHLVPHATLMVDASEGIPFELERGGWVLPFRPTHAESLSSLKRRTQIIYPKDQGLILMWADVRPGQRILESGIGSGALTVSLLRMVRPGGSIVSVERRPEHAEEAIKVIQSLDPSGLSDHRLVIADMYSPDPFFESTAKEAGGFDRVILDLPEPWKAIDNVIRVLRPGGILLTYVPTPLQVHSLSLALQESGHFHLVRTVESIVRDWEYGPQSIRPAHRIIGHTGFITTCRFSPGRKPYIPFEAPF
jgi:tRNA (adenine57-N1/adenine58-N1)-methyltransferase